MCILAPIMSSSLHSKLTDLAASFADSVVEAIRSASLDELLSESRAPGGRGRPRAAAPRAAQTKSGRLARRSADDIAAVLDKVVMAVKKHKGGLRAEQIRDELGLQSKELPRVLTEGLKSRKLRKVGRKRATTYFAK